MGVVTEDEVSDELGDEPLPVPSEIGLDDSTMLLQSVPERVSDLLYGLTADQLGYRHGPAFPTADEIARHLAGTGADLDAEITAAAVGGEHAAAPSADQPLAEVLQDWQRHRRRASDLLRGLPAERWEELKERCHEGLQHELGHLSQLRNLTALIPIA